jgi:3-phosphoshikimate 1-carboxyvinyltransferase
MAEQTFRLTKAEPRIRGQIELTGSKSIANRALIIRALTPGGFPIERMAAANDTELLQALLASEDEVRDAGPAGTTFRFLTAYLALQPGTQILTGTERMKQRPIGVLVDALRRLGASIEYLEQEGYPPLRIGEGRLDKAQRLSIEASTSSQYISALLMIAPVLPNGLELQLAGDLVSRPYVEMTLGLMRYFGVDHTWDEDTIRVPHQAYTPRPFRVEADWSAASYYYAMAAIAEVAELDIEGLYADSFQGDAVIEQQFQRFGVETTFRAGGITLRKPADAKVPVAFEWDFLQCPDVAQTLAVTCAALGTRGLYTGLQTLRIKETDRVAALKTELGKLGVSLVKLPPQFSKKKGNEYYLQEGHATWTEPVRFATYEDHRMAMAFAPLALRGPIEIADPMVVVKSYPHFYEDLTSLGFVVER